MKALVVGNGPSRFKVEYIRDFDGIIISCDKTARHLVKNGIIPDYITFSETREGLIETALNFMPDHFANQDSVVVFRNSCHPIISETAKKLNLSTLIFEIHPNTYINNVGLYSVVFAIEDLKVRELHIIGMEMKGADYTKEEFQNWISSYSKYMRENPTECNILDHSIDGQLPTKKCSI